MREILFRGKRVDGGKWVEGSLVVVGGAPYIVTELPRWDPRKWAAYLVDPATVGQYTGLTDKHGKKIFEGDIVLFKWDKEHNYCHIIEFVDGEFCATPVISRDDTWQIRICGENEKFSVIGNIHDNPDLLEVEE